ncbi:MAG: TatD family hydrolase [Porticoccaceae bacterium]|nr:TatD family hydrolase [Porticoccaceae bacterium]
MLIDIGVNLSNARFEKDIEAVLERAQESGVEKLILTGTSIEESQAVVAICDQYTQKFPGMLYATGGIHPHDASSFNRESATALRDLAAHSSVVAIGETGLDFNRNFSSPEDQQKSFEAHIELAIELRMPLFLHERDASKRQIEILHSYRENICDAVIHCFTGDKKTLFSYLDMDLHIGITGWICDERRGLELQNIVANIPLNRLMIETDAPYLTPRNILAKPKNGRNEPAFLIAVLAGIAAQRNESEDELATATTATAIKFFNLPS